ncbi:O-antigen polymerase, partial [Streptomyces sp. UNOC14_S4]|uniref:O-antigen polymerase n=1 Tax=Streptomyces sp. UNOC14_S4 TaxID=2872340 RepID=UPI001E45CE74
HPCWTILLVVVPGAVTAAVMPPELFDTWWHTPKYFDARTAVLMAAGLGTFMAGALLVSSPLHQAPHGSRDSPAGPGPSASMWLSSAQRKLLGRAGQVLVSLTLAGYLAWAVVAVVRGYGWEQVLAVVRLEKGGLEAGKRLLHPVSGVTTFTQFGPVAVACLLLHTRATGRRHTLALVVLTVLACLRALLHAERIALIELLMPAVVITVVLAPRARQRQRAWHRLVPGRRGWAWAPLAGLLATVSLFAVFEYTRSWKYHRGQGDGYVAFVLRRLGGYYTVPANNSALLTDHIAAVHHLPYYTVDFLRRAPGLSHAVEALTPQLAWHGPSPRDEIVAYVNPELNSDGGLLNPFYDYGATGAVLVWAVLGYLMVRCYRLARAGSPGALIAYSVLYVGALELGRYFYWGQGRFTPALAAALVLAWLLRRGDTVASAPGRANMTGRPAEPPPVP